jgi:hypothetical protein
MSADGREFVRGFGDLAQGRGAIAWTLAGGGGLTLDGDRIATVEADAVTTETFGGWRFETGLDDDSIQGAAVFRHVAIQAPDGATITCTASGSQGISGHGQERTDGALRADGDPIAYDEALISTQYDSAGDPTRIGLELWPPDADHTTRAAATRVSGSLIAGARSGDVWAGFFRCHTNGIEGIGTYLLWRA